MTTKTTEKRVAGSAKVTGTKTTAKTVAKALPPAPEKRERRVRKTIGAAVATPKTVAPTATVKPETKRAAAATKVETKTATPAVKRERRGHTVVEDVKDDRKSQPATLNRIYSALTMLDEFGPDITTELADMLREQCFGDIEVGKVRLAFMRKSIRRKVVSNDTEIAGSAWTLHEGDLVFVHEITGGSVHVYNTLTKTPIEAIFNPKAAKALKYDLVPTTEDEFDAFLRTEAERLEKVGIRVDWAN